MPTLHKVFKNAIKERYNNISRLDYCNSLLAGTSVSNLARLQLVQNTNVSLLKNLVFAPSHLFSLSCIGFLFAIEYISRLLLSLSRFSSSSSRHISPALFHGMCHCQHDHCDLLLHCHYVFLLEKPKWPSPNHFHMLPRVFGISSQVIFHPFPLFLLSGRNSKHHLFLSAFPGNPSPSIDITFCDVSPSTDATQVGHTTPPG